jgi:hypothetical protein
MKKRKRLITIFLVLMLFLPNIFALDAALLINTYVSAVIPTFTLQGSNDRGNTYSITPYPDGSYADSVPVVDNLNTGKLNAYLRISQSMGRINGEMEVTLTVTDLTNGVTTATLNDISYVVPVITNREVSETNGDHFVKFAINYNGYVIADSVLATVVLIWNKDANLGSGNYTGTATMEQVSP